MVKFCDIIDKWPTKAAFGSDIGVSPQSVWNMYERDSIPSRYWSATVAAAAEREIVGVSLRAMAEAAARRVPA